MAKNSSFELNLKTKDYDHFSDGSENVSGVHVSSSKKIHQEADLNSQGVTSYKCTFSNEAFMDDAEFKAVTEELSNRNETNDIFHEVQLMNLDGCVATNTESNPDDDTKHNLEDQISTNADNICGIWCFKPKWLQKLATPNWFLVLYCKLGIIQGMFFSYFLSCLITLEKRYGFSRKVSTNIITYGNITPIFLGIFIGYFCGLGHRPRTLAFAMLLHALCCFLMAVPYAAYGSAQNIDLPVKSRWQRTYLFSEQVCNPKASSDKWCNHDDDRQPAIGAILIFVFALVVVSLTKVVYYAVGLSYMDDNSRKRNIPFYISIFSANLMFGPQIGQKLASVFLNFNEDPSVDPGYGPADHRWIGAWWMGFLAQGLLLLIYIIPLTWFSHNLINQTQHLRSHFSVNQKSTKRERFKGLASAVNRLARNPVYLCANFYIIIKIIGHGGYYVTLPTYVRHQFKNDTLISGFSESLWITQVMLVIFGFLIWKFRPSVKCLTVGLVVSEIAIAMTFLFLMLSKCPKVELFNYGVLPDNTLNIQNECNMHCKCTTDYFSPVCDHDGKNVYFSSCYAGCDKFDDQLQVYYNCSCVKDNTGAHIPQQTISKDNCIRKECDGQSLAHIFSFPAILAISGVVDSIILVILLRSIFPDDKNIAIGALLAMKVLSGFFPYLIVFESIKKSTCLIWNTSCGQTGTCQVYDTDKFNYMLHGTSAALSFISALGLIAINYMRSRISDLYKDEIPENQVEEKTSGDNSNQNMFTKVLESVHSFL